MSEDNPASFSKATVTLHYSNNVNNAAENSYTITSRTGVIAFNHLKGLYALDQRSCQITIHESDVIDPGSPTGKPYLDVWMQMEAGFGSCIAEVSIFLQEWLNPALRVGELTPYGPAGLLRWAGNWGPPISWFPTTGRIWTKLFEVDPPYAAIPDNMWEVIRDPLSKRTNLYSKWPEEAQKALLYPRKRMNDASYGTAGATQMNAGNFDVAINSLYLGWEERMGLAFNTDFMDLIVAKLIERGKIT